MKKLVVVVLMLILIMTTGLNVFAYGIVCSECDRGTIYISTNQATCVSDGYEKYECTDCNFSSFKRVLRATGHQKESGVLCWRTAYCTRCNKNMGSGSLHKMKTEYDPATGETRTYCWYCGTDM